uniref:Uncharacterized protein n=1 Tax=Arundo donax TaxID=35708 RepID=A0A0A8XR43_ARUDO
MGPPLATESESEALTNGHLNHVDSTSQGDEYLLKTSLSLIHRVLVLFLIFQV